MTDELKILLDSRRLALADGATGSHLFAVEWQAGDALELWNTERPKRISDLHRSFVNAGSDIILTNSFGGTHYQQALHKTGHRMAGRSIRRLPDSLAITTKPGFHAPSLQ